LPAPNSDPSRLVEKENWLESNIELLSEAMDNLDNRSKEVLKLRWLTEEKVTLKELAKKFNVSLERVRQIEEQAILDLREQLLNP
jgi:RNA polymerase sigma-32 factor